MTIYAVVCLELLVMSSFSDMALNVVTEVISLSLAENIDCKYAATKRVGDCLPNLYIKNSVFIRF